MLKSGQANLRGARCSVHFGLMDREPRATEQFGDSYTRYPQGGKLCECLAATIFVAATVDIAFSHRSFEAHFTELSTEILQ